MSNLAGRGSGFHDGRVAAATARSASAGGEENGRAHFAICNVVGAKPGNAAKSDQTNLIRSRRRRRHDLDDDRSRGPRGVLVLHRRRGQRHSSRSTWTYSAYRF